MSNSKARSDPQTMHPRNKKEERAMNSAGIAGQP